MELVSEISAAIRMHDPLEPWLTESHWDENYWDSEATEVARRLRPGMTADDVRTVITTVLRESLPENFADENVPLGPATSASLAECCCPSPIPATMRSSGR